MTFWESWCVLGGVCVRVWHCARRSQKWCQKGLKRPRSRERQNWCKEGPKVLQGARQNTGVASEIAKGHWPLLLVAVWRDFWQTRSGNCWIFGKRYKNKGDKSGVLSGCVSRRATKHWRRIRNGRRALAIASGFSLARFFGRRDFWRKT